MIVANVILGPVRTALTLFGAAALAVLATPSGALASNPPVISTSSSTDIQGVSALLRGEVNPGGLTTDYHFEYVDSGEFEADQPNGFAHAQSTAVGELNAATQDRSVSAALSALSQDTTYKYRLIVRNSAGTESGPEEQFTTSHGFGLLPGSEGFDVAATVADEPEPPQATLAGSHPYELVTKVNFSLGGEFDGQPGVPFTDGDVKDLHIDLPPGLIENPAAVPQCTQADFHTPRQSPYEKSSLSGENCPKLSQIGVVTVRSNFAGGSSRSFGVFNLRPPPGVPSEFGFSPFGAPVTLRPHVREAGGEYGLTLDLVDFPQQFDTYGLRLAIWGVPWTVSHDEQRGNCLNEADANHPFAKCSIEPPQPNQPTLPYLTLPTSCAAPMTFTIRADSWQQPGVAEATSVSRDSHGHPRALEGCDALGFEPAPLARLSVSRTTSSSGFDFTLDGNSAGLLNPGLRAKSQVRNAVISLPEGVTINPSVGAGLGVCTPAQYAAENASAPPGSACPNSSKIGEVTVESPLFEGAVKGGLFLAQPDNPETGEHGAENPFDTLVALYMVAKSPERGILVKVAGKVTADPGSGQLVATFVDLPELPYSHFNVHFRDGQRSPLATPPKCGIYSTGIDLTSWLSLSEHTHADSPLQLSSGIGGGPCPLGVPPFSPGAQAGTLNRNAGSYTPFYLHLTRTDAEQEITSYSTQLPPGLLGKIAGIPYCPEDDIEAAKLMSGVEEAEHPSCPAASKIGHTVSGYGLGSDLAYAPGGLYLAGPYHGQPLSIVAIDSATVGPFDLGVVVVRSAIKVDPQTARVGIDSAGSDPIPHILDGIPIHLRDIRVYLDRPDFILNPTSCEQFSVPSTLTGSGAHFSDPSDDAPATAVYPFQVSNCSALGFAPRLRFKLTGGTKRGDYPQLTATVRPRQGDANIGRASVTLPKSIFLAQEHLGTVCTRPQFADDRCSAESIYGHATAVSPLLSEPLEGPVYLRSSHNPLPDLVAALKGSGVSIEVAGRIDSKHGGLRGTFNVLPDAPVTKFVMELNGGKKGVLVNAADICAPQRFATVQMIGQNNQGERFRSPLVAECGKHAGGRHQKQSTDGGGR